MQKLNCPVCKSTIEWNDTFPHRPFCSKRCQQIDFGDWATEAYAIKGSAKDVPEFDEFSLDEAGVSPDGFTDNN